MDRAALLAAMAATSVVSVKPHPVDVPGWGTVYVRALSVEDFEAQVNEQLQPVPEGTAARRRAAVRKVARSLCDAHGARIFDPDSETDLNELARQPWLLIKRVLTAIDTFNAASEEGVAEAKKG